jgi:hypothetical protein
MKGRRVFDFEDPIEFQPGDYGFYKGYWWVYPPEDDTGPIMLKGWTITENEDKTITVNPSIQVRGKVSWHGYLTNGEWREC